MVGKGLKLIVCGGLFYLGSTLAGVIASALGFPAAALAPGETAALSNMYDLATAPLMALVIILVARGVAGSLLVRSLVLTNLIWIAYSLTNELEGLVFASYATSFWPTVVLSILPCGLCAATAAYLFPTAEQNQHQPHLWEVFFDRRKAGSWIWRLILASLIFTPVYFILGLVVMPFVGPYYEQNVGGLQQPEVGTLFMVLLLRSVLFFFACLPVIVLWKKSQLSLWLSLGFGLSVWVGLLYLLSAYWLPAGLRLIHAAEIIMDEFPYAGLLVWILQGFSRGLHQRRAAHPASV